ncbi:succinylglutamate desuccinylase/aspartoacylase domain-containing protein [Paraferrimonas sedimenticola]|uniref:Succinylglutamate desuccinylase n=1 Tax=Paraferrimonas sedimenticola TaxID=375674 RepID=A0AA37W082_9GAMM|nr:succinylglutamate desuccinylase/aspartoacylase family protein [Paraferrimonas sedimenticola]GLP98141.1 succinylglutamate desuccinylase [Paraferrimonas sedimenticola]
MLNKESITVGQLATGQALDVPVYRYNQGRPGPKVYIQANLHGAEVQGNAVLLALLERLKTLEVYGEVTLVPLSNPMGINQKSGEFTLGRFDPVTGVNWNRQYLGDHIDVEAWLDANPELSGDALTHAFRAHLVEQCETRLVNPWGVSTGQHLCYRLQALAHEHDIVLDLHTGPKSCRHLYCPEILKAQASHLNIPCVLLMPNEFAGALDEACFHPWWQLQQALAKRGHNQAMAVQAYTLELGSQELIDIEAADQDAIGITSFLGNNGVIADAPAPAKMDRYACLLKDYRKLHAPGGAMVEYLAPLGEPLKAGEPLARLLKLEQIGQGQVVETLNLPQDAIPVLHFASAAVHQGTELYKLMTNYYKL